MCFKNKKKSYIIHHYIIHYFSLSSKLQAFNHKPLDQTFEDHEKQRVQTLQRMIQINDSKRGTVRIAEMT